MDNESDRAAAKPQPSMSSTIAPWAAVAAAVGGLGIFLTGGNSLLILLAAAGAIIWLVCVCVSAFG